MKKILAPLALAFGLFAVSCGDSQTEHNHTGGTSANEAAVPESSDTDKLFDDIMGFHDEAMPKMGKLKGYQTLATQKVDSLSKLSDAASKALQTEFSTLLTDLQRAEKGMMDWMDAFTPKEETDDEATVKEYYNAEKEKARTMRDDIFNVLKRAEEKLGS